MASNGEIKHIGSVVQPGAYLGFDSGRLISVSIKTDVELKSAQWVLESLEPFGLPRTFRIRHRLKEDHYLHAESELLACEPIHWGANSSYWIVDPLPAHGTFTIRNFWRSNWYIYKTADGVATGSVDPKALSSQWSVESANRNSLLVPIHLDALWLDHDQAVLEPRADFSRLPYFHGLEDVNPNTPNLSEEILTPAMQPPQLYLKRGLHLHWALPDALHRGEQPQAGGLEFFRTPDRWLVIKTANGTEKQWIVESNYLHPPGDHKLETAISYPHRDPAHPQPFRYLGRKVPREAWSEADPNGTNPGYLHHLTALGYGEPTFAAFYPNCHSVFGFYDEESAGETIGELKGVRYEVIGWHGAAGSDVLADTRFQAKVEALRLGHQAAVSTDPYRFEALKTTMGWVVEDAGSDAFPASTIYFARLSLAADTVLDPGDRPVKAVVAIGNSATEALSAHLGAEVGGAGRKVLEQQLEALQLLPELEGQQLDTGPRFREARHTQGFRAVHGELVSSFRPDSRVAGAANAPHDFHSGEGLPESLALSLDALNTLRRRYHEVKARLESQQEQLFSDWYKYMVAAYPPEDSRDDFPDMDEIAWFIREHSLPQVESLQGEAAFLLEKCKQAQAEFERELEALQQILVTDIRDWGAFLDLLGGRGVLPDERFRVVLQRIGSLLTASWKEVLAAVLSGGARSLSNEEKEALTDTINAILEKAAESLIPQALIPALPTEALELFEKNTSLAPTQRRRLGRLILEAALPHLLVRRSRYVAEYLPGPKYWEPAEPVVLIADADLKLTNRHGEDGSERDDGLLACYLLIQEPDARQDFQGDEGSISAIRTRLDELQKLPAAGDSPDGARIGFYTWKEQPWHPFMLEWEVELFPLKEDGRHITTDSRYDPGFMDTHYDFPEEEVDFTLKGEVASIIRSANIYTGRSLMLDYAQPQLVERLEAYITKHLAPLYYEANKIPAAERSKIPPLDKVTEWAVQNLSSLSSFNQAVLAIQRHLAQNRMAPIAQALSGFNAALLQYSQTLQLPVEDPLGFSDAEALAHAVAEATGRANRRAPQPLNDFNPLRTGALRLHRLRLVDTFGRIQTFFDDATPQELLASEPLKKIDSQSVLLPPRLVQPARLNFQWLAARSLQEGKDMRTSAHPATSPICGWLIPNYFDNSLLVYNEAGQALGALRRSGEEIVWSASPGRLHRMLELEIPNRRLYKLVNYFLGQNSHFLDDALTAMESALENILPESSAGNDSMAFLAGRPLAVVRASLRLEIKGSPAVNKDWNLFRQTIQTGVRESDNFSSVTFPIRVGEHNRLDDGLVGFWIEERSGGDGQKAYVNNKFYFPQTPDSPRTGSIDHPDIVIHRGTDNTHLRLAADTPEQVLTMLVDPRGPVHISSGILPVHSLRISPDQYASALRDIELTFFSGPFLTRADGIELPIPIGAGFAWSLLTKENGAWADTHAIDPVEQNATFSGIHLIREGWLKLKKDTTGEF